MEATVAKPSNRNGRMPIADHLKRNEIVLDVPESEKICPVTGKARPCIGEEVSESQWRLNSLFASRRV